MLFSHKDRELHVHLEEVFLEVCEKTNDICTRFASLCHDLAKAMQFFQDHVLNGIDSGSNRYHSLLSAYWAFKLAKKNGFSKEEQCFIFNLVAGHHTSLGWQGDKHSGVLWEPPKESRNKITKDMVDSIRRDELGDIEKLFNKYGYEFEAIKNINISIDAFEDFEIKDIYQIAKLQREYSILTYCDEKMASFDRQKIPIMPDKLNSAIFASTPLNDWRNELQKEILEKLRKIPKEKGKGQVYILSAPTGSGKTRLSTELALEMGKKRIIYCLPYVAILDEVKDSLSQWLPNSKQTLLTDHYLSEKLAETRTWDRQFILTTFVQLYQTMTSRYKAPLLRHNLLDENTVIILDEVQVFNWDYIPLISELLENLVNEYHLTVIISTATKPPYFMGGVKPHLLEFDKPFNLNRSQIIYKSQINNLDILLNEHYDINKKYIYIFNRVSSSREFYQKFTNKYPDARVIYLSRSVLSKDKQLALQWIRENQNEPFVIISTQVIEAGVNIDADIIYRSLAPIDNLVQVAGRANRNGREGTTGIVYVVPIVVDDRNSQALEGKVIYGNESIQQTINILSKKDIIYETDYKDMLNIFYEALTKYKSDKNANKVLNDFKKLFLSKPLIEEYEDGNFYIASYAEEGIHYKLQKSKGKEIEVKIMNKGYALVLRSKEYLHNVRELGIIKLKNNTYGKVYILNNGKDSDYQYDISAKQTGMGLRLESGCIL